jgi:hypothetical protein
MGRRMALLLLTAAAGFAAAGCGAGNVKWQGVPRVQSTGSAPGAHLLYGTIVNRSGATLTLKAADVRVLDGSGHALPSAAGFSGGYLPAVALQGYGAQMFASVETGAGARVRLAPGARVPLSVGWTARDGAPATRIRVAGSSLTLP